MTFRHIFTQNLVHNLKQFISYLFVNSFVIAVLFMYGSLLFNVNLQKGEIVDLVNSFTVYGAYATIVFSIIFVSYTGIYFVKSRGKEFGVYLTLGMTSKDLIFMTIIENIVILLSATILGIISGVLFSKLFYLILAKVLNLSADIYYIDYKTFLLSIGVFSIIFICNMIFTSVFIKKLSIIDIIKSTSQKGVSKSKPLLGIIALIVFSISMIGFYIGATMDITMPSSLKEYKEILKPIIIVTTLVSLYYSIAFCIDGITYIFSHFPKAYNKYILTLGNLKHKFFSYKVSVYIISLLIALSIYFMGFGLSTYLFIDNNVEFFIPYDFMIESTDTINVISQDEIFDTVNSQGGEIKEFSKLDFLISENFNEFNDDISYLPKQSMIISESTYNKHMGTKIDVKEDELILLFNTKEQESTTVDYNVILTMDSWEKGKEGIRWVQENSISKNDFINYFDTSKYLEFKKDKIEIMHSPFINSYGNFDYIGVVANVIDDGLYNKITSTTNSEKRKVFLFNLESGNGDLVYSSLLDVLREKNGSDKNLWSKAQTDFYTRNSAENLRPIYKSERYEEAFQITGILFFSVMFLGILFLVSSIVVLYYKIVTDIEDEKEQIKSFKRIGLTTNECKSYLQTHIKILFFTPLLLGGLLGLYFIYISFVFTSLVGHMQSLIFIAYIIFLLFGVLLYLQLKKKFIRQLLFWFIKRGCSIILLKKFSKLK